MSILKEVTISGTVGKQVIATTAKARLHQMVLVPSAVSAAVMVVRNGNASGEVVMTIKAAINTPARVPLIEKTGMDMSLGVHCKVTGTGGVGYLELN